MHWTREQMGAVATKGNWIEIDARGGRAKGCFAIEVLLLATAIRWTSIVLAAHAVSTIPVKALVMGLLR
jgi:hypothetical protein